MGLSTAPRLNALGWKSVSIKNARLRLAPEDLEHPSTAPRWAQGTLQFFSGKPLSHQGHTLGQRLMYFATMYSYFNVFQPHSPEAPRFTFSSE